MRFYVVDDDPLTLELVASLLDAAGHDVVTERSSEKALSELPLNPPDCVLLDLVMPGIDGFEVCRLLRKQDSLKDMRLVVLSVKSFDSDRLAALESGADAYLMKPIRPSSFVEQLEAIIHDQIRVRFWGVRGTLTVPGEKTVRYGGNTACVSCELPKGDLLILDAGSGLKVLSDHLQRDNGARIQGRILLTHPHWDHLHALPFFAPLYVRGSELEICGPATGGLSTNELVSAQLDGIYFPVTLDQLLARVYFRDLVEGVHDFGGYEVRALRLQHPGNCLGYRIDWKGSSICYLTDHEILSAEDDHLSVCNRERWRNFVRGADMLVADTTYTENEYEARHGWGHATVERVVRDAAEADVQSLYLFHHDPDQDDDAIDRKLEVARETARSLGSKLRCVAPREGDLVQV